MNTSSSRNHTRNSSEELPFEGFAREIQTPLQKSDPQSYKRIRALFLDSAARPNQPFSFLLNRMTGKLFPEKQALDCWRQLLAHKGELEEKLGRGVSIQTAAVDFFTIQGASAGRQRIGESRYTELEPVRNARGREEWIDRIYLPSYYMERLKEEVSRAARYRHALSAILLDIDAFHLINEQFAYKTGDEVLTLIVKIIKKTIRNVDIIARYSGDRFLVILPNTNQREARELAERLRQSIPRRTARIPSLNRGITATLAVSQVLQDERSVAFMRRIEGLLKKGKDQQRNAVYA
jgi:diguanylate cyclase (GGDEF)-like protein